VYAVSSRAFELFLKRGPSASAAQGWEASQAPTQIGISGGKRPHAGGIRQAHRIQGVPAVRSACQWPDARYDRARSPESGLSFAFCAESSAEIRYDAVLFRGCSLNFASPGILCHQEERDAILRAGPACFERPQPAQRPDAQPGDRIEKKPGKPLLADMAANRSAGQ